jgi:hypothetical protein
MKKINEYELLDRVNGLREKIVESEQQTQEDLAGTFAKYAAPVGNVIKGAASKAWNGVKAAGSAMANNPVKTALGVAGATALGANALAPSAAKPAAAPKGTTAPKGGGKSDPAVLKQQQDLIAKGAKIKADGIMGPATQAAIAQFGGAAAAPAATTAPAAPPAGAPGAQDDATGVDAAVAAQQAAGAPQPSMDDSDDVNAREFVPPTATAGTPPPPAVGTPPVATNAASLKAAQDAAAGKAPAPMAGGYGSGATPAAAPAAAAPAAAAPAAAPAGDWESSPVAASKLTPQQAALAKTAGFATNNQQAAALAAKNLAAVQAGQPISAQESVGFQNEELSRIMTLIHHR